MCTLLLVDDNTIPQTNLKAIIGNNDVQTTVAASAKEALEMRDRLTSDCMVGDPGLPVMSGVDLIEKIKANPNSRGLSIIVYTAKDLLKEEESRLRHLTENILIKDFRSPERLLDETALLLHRNASR